ncbi:cbb3-type cytochrome c oxidase N-terminal domain-containing protein [Luteolibacter marinus]|uniref:cbb3-type cytochrome c oxidase N-terminal domain-containing protein n=1 Tax=Luteolibacter marinus TaxID=2776705 RepID=UPI001865D487|nr:cbb3-type cytochrome c oxidase N-terminal domain-containing protein [Luteolibacter marinus]
MNPEIKRGNYAKEKGEVILREHEYDGIQEFDQKLPNWWLFTFYGAIVWFVVYWGLYYHSNVYQTDQEKIIAQVGALQEKKDAELAATLASLDDETLIGKWSTDPAIVAAGEATYMVNCVACHAADLSATMDVAGNKIPLPGRALNDGVWEHGGKPMDVFKIINEGTPEGSTGLNGAKMQAWGQMLSPKQVAEVTAYLISRNSAEFAN